MELPNPPLGGYKTIVIDPPWPCHLGNQSETGLLATPRVGARYNLMGEREIKRLNINLLAAEDAHLFCWTTQRFLPLAIECLPWWGFKYHFVMVWHKPGGPKLVGYPKYNCEFVVYGHRGPLVHGKSHHFGFHTTKGFWACFNAAQGRHSEKPAEFYDLLRRVTPGPRIDLFARRRHEGFDAWGNEAEEE